MPRGIAACGPRSLRGAAPVVASGRGPPSTLPVTRGSALTFVTTPLRLFRSHRSAVSRALAPIIAGAVLATAMAAPAVSRRPHVLRRHERQRQQLGLDLPSLAIVPRLAEEAPRGRQALCARRLLHVQGHQLHDARRHVHEPDPHLRLSRRAPDLHGHVDTGGLPVLLEQQRVRHASRPDDPGRRADDRQQRVQPARLRRQREPHPDREEPPHRVADVGARDSTWPTSRRRR